MLEYSNMSERVFAHTTISEKTRGNKELKEIPEEAAKFLAGILEMGGSFIIGVSNEVEHSPRGDYIRTRIRPTISYNDNDEEKIEALQRMYGGSKSKIKDKNSWTWRATDSLALHLATVIQPYAPSREKEIEAFQAVEAAQTLEYRIALAKWMSEYNHTPKSYPDLSVYEKLIKDPAFVSGVYEGRGNIYDDNPSALVISSLNVSLITALQEEYGGSVVPFINERPVRNPEASIPISFKVQLGLAGRQNLLKVAQSHIISDKSNVAAITGIPTL